MKKTTHRPYPTHPTPETIAEARAWLLEACAIDGCDPTPENLRALAQEHSDVLRGGAFRVQVESLLLAIATLDNPVQG